MRAIGAILAVLLGLSACSSQLMWTKPGLTQEQFDRDEYECIQAAYIVPRGGGVVVTQGGGNPFGDGFARGLAIGQSRPRVDSTLYMSCMRAHGYQPVEQ